MFQIFVHIEKRSAFLCSSNRDIQTIEYSLVLKKIAGHFEKAHRFRNSRRKTWKLKTKSPKIHFPNISWVPLGKTFMHRVFVLHSSFWLSYHAHHIFKRLILQPTPFHSTAAATTENVLEIHRNDQHVYSDCWCYCRCLAPWKTQNSYKFSLVGRIVWILTKFSWLNAKCMLGWRETLILVFFYSRWISANYTVSTLFK